jgi:branched-chain amino acid transport system substrate-binding protein
VAGLLCFALGGMAHAETVRIGLLLSLSGVGADIGESMERGIRLYVSQHRSELPAGVDVQLLTRDDKSDADTARRLGQELIVRDHVQFLAGVSFSPQAFALAPLVTEAKVPLILMNATTASLTRASPYIVRVSHTQWQEAYTVGQWAAAHGVESAYVLVSDYVAGLDTEKAFKSSYEKAGGRVLGSIRVPIGTMDFFPYMDRVRASGAKALFMFTIASGTTAAVKAFVGAGLRRQGMMLLGPGDLTPDDHLREMGEDSVGMVTGAVYVSGNPLSQSQAFLRLWKAAYGDELMPNTFSASAYDGMAAIFSAIRAVPMPIHGDAAIAVLKTWKGPDSPKGAVMVDPQTRDIIQNVYMARIASVEGRPQAVIFDTVPAVRDPWKVLNPQ